MDKTPFSDIISLVHLLNDTLLLKLPSLEREVKQLIKAKSVDKILIENYLDTFILITTNGVGEKTFVKLLDYYKTVDANRAAFFWNQFDSLKDDEWQ